MKRFLSVLICAVMLACPFSAFAQTDSLPTGTAEVGYWTLDDYAEPWHDLYILDSGDYYLDAGELCQSLGGSFRFFDTSAELCIYGYDISIFEGDTKFIINGEEYDFDYLPIAENGCFYLELSDAAWLFFLIPYESSDWARETYSLGDKPAIFLAADCYFSLSAEQQTALQGISAPMHTFEYLLTVGGGSLDALNESYSYLNPFSGVPHYENIEFIKNSLQAEWQITDGESLLDTVNGLFSSAHRQEFSDKLSAGAVDFAITQKFPNLDPDTALLGWDLAQAAQLVQWGYCAGYIDPMTSMSVLLDIAAQVQDTFDDFTAYGQDVLLGYNYLISTGEDEAFFADMLSLIYDGGLYNGYALGTVLPDSADVGTDNGEWYDEEFGFGTGDGYYDFFGSITPGEHWSDLPEEPMSEEFTALDFLSLFIIAFILNGFGAVIGLVWVVIRNRNLRRMQKAQRSSIEPWTF